MGRSRRLCGKPARGEPASRTNPSLPGILPRQACGGLGKERIEPPPAVSANPVLLATSQKDSQRGRIWVLLWLTAGEANGHGRQAARFHGRRQQTGQTGYVKDGPNAV